MIWFYQRSGEYGAGNSTATYTFDSLKNTGMSRERIEKAISVKVLFSIDKHLY